MAAVAAAVMEEATAVVVVLPSTKDSQAKAAIGWKLIVGATREGRRKSRSGNSSDGWRRRVKGCGKGSWDGDEVG